MVGLSQRVFENQLITNLLKIDIYKLRHDQITRPMMGEDSHERSPTESTSYGQDKNCETISHLGPFVEWTISLIQGKQTFCAQLSDDVIEKNWSSL